MTVHAVRFAAPSEVTAPAAEMSPALEQPYLDLLREVLETGPQRADRTGVGTRGVFGRQMRFDLSRGFPLLTTKRVHFKSVVAELVWFLSGSTSNHDLRGLGCTIWDEWADPETGDLGPVYGKQWRSWAAPDGRSIDQIAEVVEGLKADPYGRRHVVSAWNPADREAMALPPCHCLFQFHVTPPSREEGAGGPGRLSCQLYQRSADLFLGVPFNIASYALLTHMVARVVGLEVGEFVHTLGDAHLYLNHAEQAQLQLSREPRLAPRLVLAPGRDLFAFAPADVALEGYDPHPAIKAPVAV